MSFALNENYFSDCFSDGEVSRMMEGTGHNAVDALPEFVNNWDLSAGNVPQTDIQVLSRPFPGDYNFDFTVEETSSRSSYVYSNQLNRLYIDMNKVARIKFTWDGTATLHVRAMLLYNEPDYEKNAVSRCRTHEDPIDSSNNGYNYVSHVLRCDDERAVYTENRRSARKSVIAFLDHIPPGADGVTVPYRLMCKTSCVGGINRRKTDIVFTLEDSNNHVVGRAVLGVKVCSCPRRDKDKDETPIGKKRKSDSSVIRTAGKTMKTETETEPYNIYQVRVPAHRNLEFETFFAQWLAGASLPNDSVQQLAYNSIIKL